MSKWDGGVAQGGDGGDGGASLEQEGAGDRGSRKQGRRCKALRRGWWQVQLTGETAA